MNQSRDIPGVIAPPPIIALATFLLGLVLDWILPSFFILRGILGFGTRLIVGAVLIASGATIAGLAIRSFLRAGTNVDPWKPAVSLGDRGNLCVYTESHVSRADPNTRGTCYRARFRLDGCSTGPGSTNPAFRRG